MTTATAPEAATTTSTGDPGDRHIYCCNPDIAMCGTDISGHDFEDFDEATCVVCADLDDADAPCNLCGYGTEVTPC